ncbi:MAG: CarD family transcriptional regulator [Hungatella sp.]|nr:CarD family transcriptional regulator [Hungatella sp.]
MFGKGEYIVYGTTGVCQVKDITSMSMDERQQEKLYYILEPMGVRGSRIMTPVEGNKSIMRPVLSRDEAYHLIDGIQDVDELWITDDKQREMKYKEALKTCDCRQWIGMIKTLYVRKKDRMSRGKRLTEVDERYFRKAKENLYRELSIPLEIPAEEVEKFIAERMDRHGSRL